MTAPHMHLVRHGRCGGRRWHSLQPLLTQPYLELGTRGSSLETWETLIMNRSQRCGKFVGGTAIAAMHTRCTQDARSVQP